MKYPALDKSKNLPSRKEFIEPDYVNGVYDEDGNELIRPLTENEKAFINQFYEETIVTNFLHNPELKELNKTKKAIIEDDIVKGLKLELAAMKASSEDNKKDIRDLSEIIKLTKKQNEEIYVDELRQIENKMRKIRKKTLLYPNKEDHKKFYNENNSRNSCIFNRSKSGYKLEYFDRNESDKILMNMNRSFTLDEDSLIDELERYHWEQMEERLRVIKEEELELKKLSKRNKNTKNKKSKS